MYLYETQLTCDLSAAFLWFACDFGWANDPSFCGWTSEDSGFRWQIQSSGTPTLNTGPNMDHTGTDKTTTTEANDNSIRHLCPHHYFRCHHLPLFSLAIPTL